MTKPLGHRAGRRASRTAALLALSAVFFQIMFPVAHAGLSAVGGDLSNIPICGPGSVGTVPLDGGAQRVPKDGTGGQAGHDLNCLLCCARLVGAAITPEIWVLPVRAFRISPDRPPLRSRPPKTVAVRFNGARAPPVV